MLFYDFQVGDKSYQLRLTTKSIVDLEKKIGMNPLGVFGDGSKLPTLSLLLDVFHASLQPYNHGISLQDAYDIFDKWIEEGHNITQFVSVIFEVYKVSGLVDGEIEIEEKN